MNERNSVSKPFLLCMLIGFSVLSATGFVFGAPDSSDWLMYGNGPSRTGFSPSSAPETNSTLWTAGLGWLDPASSPVIVDGRLYVSSGETKCYDAETGEEIWLYPAGSSEHLAVVDGKVYFSAGGAGGEFYCLDAVTGDLLWKKEGYWYPGTPVVAYSNV